MAQQTHAGRDLSCRGSGDMATVTIPLSENDQQMFLKMPPQSIMVIIAIMALTFFETSGRILEVAVLVPRVLERNRHTWTIQGLVPLRTLSEKLPREADADVAPVLCLEKSKSCS